MKTRIKKNIFNKNERRCRDIKTQKACEQGQINMVYQLFDKEQQLNHNNVISMEFT